MSTLTPHRFPLSPIISPSLLPSDNTGSGFALNVATKAVAAFVTLYPGDTIHSLSVAGYSNHTGSNTEYVLSVETIVNNAPSGSLVAANAKTANNQSMAALDNNSRVWSDLIAPYTNNTGAVQHVALVMRAGGTAYGASNYGTVQTQMNRVHDNADWMPYTGTYDGASWTLNWGRPAIAARDATGQLVCQSHTAKSHSSIAFNTGSGVPQIRGVRWLVQEWARLAGVLLVTRRQTSSDFDLHVYRTPVGGVESLVSTASYVKSVMPGGTSDVGALIFPLTPAECTPGDVVRIVYEAKTATSPVTWNRLNFASAAELNYYLRGSAGAEPFLCYTSSDSLITANSGSWSDADTQLPAMVPCIDARKLRPLVP